MSCIYDNPNPQVRSELWERLQRTATTRNEPWIMLGDFDQICSNDEKIGGHLREAETFREFNTTLEICDMLELKSQGNKFSWSGNRSVVRDGVRTIELIQCCLDKALAIRNGSHIIQHHFQNFQNIWSLLNQTIDL